MLFAANVGMRRYRAFDIQYETTKTQCRKVYVRYIEPQKYHW